MFVRSDVTCRQLIQSDQTFNTTYTSSPNITTLIKTYHINNYIGNFLFSEFINIYYFFIFSSAQGGPDVSCLVNEC